MINSIPLTTENLILGSILSWNNGEPMPPSRFKKKRAEWERHNGKGQLISIERETRDPESKILVLVVRTEDLHGDTGMNVKINSYISPNAPGLKIEQQPQKGSVLVIGSDLLTITRNEDEARTWMAANGYSNATIQTVP